MTDALRRHFEAARAWLAEAAAGRFVDARHQAALDSVESRTPADLFTEPRVRPLVVAFFGGTGVGKSSLLNRLAAREIARTGVERPTSRELTLYVHRDVALADLPADLPLGEIRVERHDDAARRHVMWVDAPDVDSTVGTNRRAVMAWLPFVDLVVYVVSPERYRDDVGWRVLLERRGRHGWVFVLNRWDEGSPEQRDDFERILRGAGFDTPALLCTCCDPRADRSALPSPDEFEHVEQAVRAVADEHGRHELERLGVRARLSDLRAALDAAARDIGDAGQWAAAGRRWQARWSETQAALLEGLEWPMRSAAARLAAREGGGAWSIVRGGLDLLREARRDPRNGGAADAATGAAPASRTGPASAELTYLTSGLWDDWARGRLAAAVESAENELYAERLPAAAVRESIQRVVEAAPEALVREMQTRLRAALALPGSRAQRAARRVTGFLMVSLPFAAGAWIAVHVVNGFRLATESRAAFLGADFAIHSAMLLLVSWAVPFTLDRLLRPSLERTMLRAGREALSNGLRRLGMELHRCIEAGGERAAELRAAEEAIVREIELSVHQEPPRSQPALRRVLARADSPA